MTAAEERQDWATKRFGLARYSVLALALGVICAAGSVSADACSIRVGWSPYAIYTFVDADGKLTGADIEILRAVAADIGCEVTFADLPWPRILREIEKGTLDATSSASHTEAREAFAHFSIPYRRAEMAVYVRRGEARNYRLDGLASISKTDFKLGVVKEYYYGSEFEELLKNPDFSAQIDPAVDNQTSIRKLVHGRVDGILAEDVGVILAEARTLGVGDFIERYPLYLPGDEFHMMFSRKSVSEELVDSVNRSLEEMRLDGRLQDILGRFLK